MNDPHEEMRVAPDPLLAEELRRRLHARLASGEQDERVGEGVVAPSPSADTDPDDREGDLITLRTEDHPTGHEPPTRRGAGPRRWLLVGAAAVAVVAVGVTLVVDDDERVETATPPAIPARDILEVHDDPEIEPGHYFIDPDGDASSSLLVFYEVADEGWSPWSGALKFNDTAHTAINITTVDNVVAHGCTDHSPADPPVGPSVEDLANALAALEPFEVTAAPSAVTAFGYEGIHLQLTVPVLEIAPRGGDLEYADCMNGVLVSWINDHYLGGPFRGYDTEPGRTEDFWILDVDGQRLVIETNEGPSSPAADLAERDAIFDSIQIQP